jgi:murein DD-endopeptidase MepM/ murein hydrolase activator NlpD
MKALQPFLLGVILLLPACQAAAPDPTLTLPPSDQPSASATYIDPSLTPSPIPSQTPLATAWPTYNPPTLAPFPLGENPEQLQITQTRPEFDAPIAISEFDHYYFSLPVDPADVNNALPSQRYGTFQDGSETAAHLGLDLSVDSGSPVYAAASGTVIWANYGLLFNSVDYIDDPYGISVVIKHDFGYEGERLYTIYAHLRETVASVGQYVQRGELIARSGSTGQSSGPHLHFEVRVGTNTIYFTRNPELWIAPQEDRGTLVGRLTTSRNALLFNRLIELTSRVTNQKWTTYTYATEFRLLPDENFDENFVFGDLPAGTYEVAIPYLGTWRRIDLEIKPGETTFFHFRGSDGYDLSLPTKPGLTFVPD